ncbi:6-phospho-beta-glucosidase GmuD [Lentibacillus populi]|uniref:6-phospho-beta-glucosidase GmuD n=1 Tax=Lentibacillus populi TaxID=1827502 RepID=A0A9W5U1Z8_9BACI|nr:glycoside hydrolase family 1 protein [Lentibacillus populi]MBT2217659.1 glycoside hydrolase family 1 protein [Virgibacillus dakarensis]GGB60543.1 6-phospho-beta-glucosidase GmuD [Lentibacillus populi]
MALQYKFPENFWWGSATSATQIEGAANEDGKGKNIWDHWYETEPNRFYENIGPETTSDFYHRYKEDIQLMKDIGHNTFRMSISWARLIPDGRGELNPAAVSFYNNVIDELITNDIEPFVTLFHFDMPLELQNQGGWEIRAVVDAYTEYAREAFRLFGDRVKKWFTFNEPIVPVEGGYLYDFHYPNVVDARRAAQVAYHTMIAHAKAVRAFHESNVADGKIGIILNLTPSYPRSQNPADLRASRIADLFFNRSFLDPAVLGEYPQELIDILNEHGLLPVTERGDRELLKANTADILGVNYYQPRRVKAKEYLPNPYSPFMPDWFFDNYEMPGRKMNKYRGWEIYEKGIYDIMQNLKENYGNIESFVSENGMGVQDEERFVVDKEIQDDYRIDFIREHLKWLHKAIEEGCNVKGYHLWSFMDNWSWMNAYKNRYGFFSVDLRTKQRTPKKSAHWIKEVSQNNGF